LPTLSTAFSISHSVKSKPSEWSTAHRASQTQPQTIPS
jgi:hypothetical protein